jgi:hypothetical protein
MARRWVWSAFAVTVLVVVTATVAVVRLRPGPRPGSLRSLRSVVRYDFDAGLGARDVYDRAKTLPLTPSEAAGGVLRTEPHDGGLAVRFPQVCAVYGDPSCPRAILQSGPAPPLDPGTAPLRFGASVLIAADETTKGGNVLQKGYSVGDSQFKLQVDGHAGKPSCVLVGAGERTIHVVESSRTVANGQWHVIECSRVHDVLTITVDGRLTGRGNVPRQLSIVNNDPLRIGGKGTSPNNDQFHGAIDDAYVSIGT